MQCDRLMLMVGLSFLTLSRWLTTDERRFMIIPMLCVTIFVILVVWFLLPRVARLMNHTTNITKIEIGRAGQQECRDRDLHSFPTRRSSDLDNPNALRDYFRDIGRMVLAAEGRKANEPYDQYHENRDRKSGSAGMPRPRSTLFPYTTLFRS